MDPVLVSRKKHDTALLYKYVLIFLNLHLISFVGADSLVIPLDGTSRNSKLARSKLGSYYERMSDGTSSLFGDEGANVLLKELKVYQGVYEEGEFIPFTDAEPFALY